MNKFISVRSSWLLLPLLLALQMGTTLGQYASPYPATGYPAATYPVSAYPATAYPVSSYPVSAYPAATYPASPYPAMPYSSPSYGDDDNYCDCSIPTLPPCNSGDYNPDPSEAGGRNCICNTDNNPSGCTPQKCLEGDDSTSGYVCFCNPSLNTNPDACIIIPPNPHPYNSYNYGQATSY